MTTINLDIDKSSLNLLVSLYFGKDERAWYKHQAECAEYSGVMGALYRLGLVRIVESTKPRIYLPKRIQVRFGVTAAGEEVIKLIFLADPDRVINASQSYLMWVPVIVTDVLRHITNGLRTDVTRLPELLVSEHPVIRETAGLVLGWLQNG